MSRFLLLVCLCCVGFLASCKSLCKPKEEPTTTPAVAAVPEVEPNVASTVTTAPEVQPCSFEPAPVSTAPCCPVEPLVPTVVPEIPSTVEVRPEPEVQPKATSHSCCEEARRLGFWQGAVAVSFVLAALSFLLCWYTRRLCRKAQSL